MLSLVKVKPGVVQKGELRSLEIFMKLEGSKGGMKRLRELRLGNSELRKRFQSVTFLKWSKSRCSPSSACDHERKLLN